MFVLGLNRRQEEAMSVSHRAERKLKRALASIVSGPNVLSVLTAVTGRRLHRHQHKNRGEQEMQQKQHEHEHEHEQQQGTKHPFRKNAGASPKHHEDHHDVDDGVIAAKNAVAARKFVITSIPPDVAEKCGESSRTQSVTLVSTTEERSEDEIGRTASYDTCEERNPPSLVQMVDEVVLQATDIVDSEDIAIGVDDCGHDHVSNCSDLSMDDDPLLALDQNKNDDQNDDDAVERAESSERTPLEDLSVKSVPHPPTSSTSDFVPPEYVYLSPTNCWPLEI